MVILIAPMLLPFAKEGFLYGSGRGDGLNGDNPMIGSPHIAKADFMLALKNIGIANHSMEMGKQLSYVQGADCVTPCIGKETESLLHWILCGMDYWFSRQRVWKADDMRCLGVCDVKVDMISPDKGFSRSEVENLDFYHSHEDAAIQLNNSEVADANFNSGLFFQNCKFNVSLSRICARLGDSNRIPQYPGLTLHLSRLFLSGISTNGGSLSSPSRLAGLFRDNHHSEEEGPNSDAIGPSEHLIGHSQPTWRVVLGLLGIACGLWGVARTDCRATTVLAWVCGIVGVLLILTGYEDRYEEDRQEPQKIFLHSGEIVPQKHLTRSYYWGTVIT